MNSIEYIKLLKSFLEHGFCFKTFENFDVRRNSQVILRHDVDFSIDMAVQMAGLEKDLGIFSTFYFLLASDSYNLLSKRNAESVKLIKDMGHSVGLHFDPTAYDDKKIGFIVEQEIFERLFGEMSSMSFHRTSQLVLEGIDWLPEGVLGAYENKFFKDIAYVSDSQGEFRFGHPLEHNAFKLCDNMQLLIHPIWWMTDQLKAVEKVKKFLILNNELMSKHIAQNCIPWKTYHE